MTVTHTASRARVHPANTLAARRRPRRLWPFAAALLSLALITGSGTVAGAVAHPGEHGAPTTMVDAATLTTLTPRVTLAPLSHGVVTGGSSLSVSVVIHNPTARMLPATTARLEVGRTPITDRTVLDAWQAGVQDPSIGDFVSGGDIAIEAVPEGEIVTAGISVDGAGPELANLAPGVYPLVLRYGSGDQAPFGTSTMIVRDADAEAHPFGIGIVVPITAPPRGTGLLTATELTALTAPTGDLTAMLDAVDGTLAILAIDPAILAAIRVLGTAAPADVRAWLERLDALPNERFSTAFADGDLATSFGAELPTPFGPTTLQSYMQPTNFVPAPAPTPTLTPDDATPPGAPATSAPGGEQASTAPSATPAPSTTPVDPDTPVFPDLATLLAVSGAHPGMAWPATGTANTALLEHLALASEADPGATLLASANTTAGAHAHTVGARGAAAGAPVLIYDSAISAALRDAASVRTPALRGAPLSAAAAQLTLASAEASGPLLVTVDRGSARTRGDLSAAISVALDYPGAAPLGLTGLLSAAPHKIDIVDAPPAESRDETARRLVDTEGSITAFATVLDDPTLLTAPERASIAQLLSAQWRGSAWPNDPTEAPDAAWNDAIVTHEAQSATTLSSVGILPPSTTNLLSADAKLQFWVRNDLPYPVNVIFITSPNDLRLEVARSKAVTALPNSNTRVEVPVIAKVGSGDVLLQLELRSPTLQPIGGPVTAEVIVRADWEFIGIVSLAAIVGTLFVVGIIRTVLSRRGRRTNATQDDPGVLDV